MPLLEGWGRDGMLWDWNDSREMAVTTFAESFLSSTSWFKSTITFGSLFCRKAGYGEANGGLIVVEALQKDNTSCQYRWFPERFSGNVLPSFPGLETMQIHEFRDTSETGVPMDPLAMRFSVPLGWVGVPELCTTNERLSKSEWFLSHVSVLTRTTKETVHAEDRGSLVPQSMKSTLARATRPNIWLLINTINL